MKKKPLVLLFFSMLFCAFSYGQSAMLIFNNTSSNTVYVTMHAYVQGSGTWGTWCSIESLQITVPPGTMGWNDYYDFEYGTSGTGPAVGWDAAVTTFTTPVGSPPPPYVNFTWTDCQFQTGAPCTTVGSATISRTCGLSCYNAISPATASGGCVTGAWNQSCSPPLSLKNVTINFY